MTPTPDDSDAMSPAPDVTGLLRAWEGGDAGAAEQLMSVVYAELHRQAARAMHREGDAHTLQATALVHEAWLRLAGQHGADWKNRAQFFGIAAQMMRRVLVDHARGRLAAKRGGAMQRITLGEVVAGAADDSELDLLALHDALQALEALDARQARLVELRYFGGLGIEETAEALGVSPATVKRDWAVARAWLRRRLGAE